MEFHNGAATDELLSRRDSSGGQAVFYVHDHLGSVRALTDAQGGVVEHYRYDAFGRPSVSDASGNELPRSAYGNRFMFTGREYLAHAGLYDFRNRTYSPRWGRFIEVDPIRFEGGDLNMYRYVGNGVLNWVDLWGLMPGDIFATPEEAVEDAAKYIPIDSSGEHAGLVYSNGDGYSATYPGTRNDPYRSSASDGAMSDGSAATDEQVYACYHSHVLPGDNDLSRQDVLGAESTGLPEILIAPDGNQTVYVPDNPVESPIKNEGAPPTK